MLIKLTSMSGCSSTSSFHFCSRSATTSSPWWFSSTASTTWRSYWTWGTRPGWCRYFRWISSWRSSIIAIWRCCTSSCWSLPTSGRLLLRCFATLYILIQEQIKIFSYKILYFYVYKYMFRPSQEGGKCPWAWNLEGREVEFFYYS